MRLPLFLILLLPPCAANAQPRTDSLLARILRGNNDAVFRAVLSDPATYRLQVIYTQVNRDRRNKPHLVSYTFNLDPSLYFNPASTVKLPLALLALEKLNDMKKPGIDKHTTMRFDSSRPWQHPLDRDTTQAEGHPSIAHFIKRAFLISENDPYNRLYQFVGQGGIQRSLREKGYGGVRITRQFAGLTPEQNRYTNPLRFEDASGSVIYRQPEGYNADSFDLSRPILLGSAHLNAADSLIKAPFDFTRHNNLPLASLQRMLQSVIFPETVPKHDRFRLTPSDRSFLLQYLSQFPSETPDPKYDTSAFYDSYVKFFFRDATHHLPPGLRVFNKVGWSYGFLTDVSYVADFANGVEFMLAATLYVNSDDILNDGRYEYRTVGYPFLYQLGQTIWHYEKSRKRAHRPDLSAFRIGYEHRDPADQRPALKDVDN
ncbi:MAG: hypothetical protein JWP27_939 [Flaviaesturariibacter sp.]|nr:hypothetical protein [Flaviaesturariibacter sp.]